MASKHTFLYALISAALRSNQNVFLCSQWYLTQKVTTGQLVESKCLWKLSHKWDICTTPLPQGSRTTKRRGRKGCKSQRAGMTMAKQCLPDMTEIVHSETQSCCGCLHKTKRQHPRMEGKEVMSPSPWLRCLEIVWFWGERQSSPKVGQPHSSGWRHNQNEVKSKPVIPFSKGGQEFWTLGRCGSSGRSYREESGIHMTITHGMKSSQRINNIFILKKYIINVETEKSKMVVWE